MGAIDVGAAATDRASGWNFGFTLLSIDNPANDTGALSSVEIWCANALVNCKVGTAYNDGGAGKYTFRDSQAIGAVTNGSKQTFSGLDFDVETDDLLGVYFTGGQIDRDEFGYDGLYYLIGDQFSTSQASYSTASGDAISLYATGTTASATSIKTLFAGTPIADLAKFNGTAISDYKKINGISNVD